MRSGAFEARFRLARLALVRRAPYLAAAVWAMRCVPAPGLGTAVVDRWWRLYVDPETAAGWRLEEYAGVLYHECCHLLRRHGERAAAVRADPELWNLAADAEINDDLVQEGVPLPGSPVLPRGLELPEGQLAEWYYDQLRRRDRRDRTPAGAGEGGDESAAPVCGSGAGGRGGPWELPGPGDGGPPGISSTEATALRRVVAAQVRAQWGDVPGHWRRYADELERAPTHDWRREFARLVRRGAAVEQGLSDYAWQRPSRRAAAYAPVLRPAMRARAANVAVVVDTSASMGADQLRRALREVEGVLRASGAGVITVLPTDASVHAVVRTSSARRLPLLGGGGTNMGAGIAAAVRLRPRPDVIVVLTDGCTPWPQEPPPIPVVVGLLGFGGNRWAATNAPEWARTVSITIR